MTVSVYNNVLAKALDKRFNLGLPTVPNFIGQTIGGAISTGSHGSSYRAHNLVRYCIDKL